MSPGKHTLSDWLPLTRDEVLYRGWDAVDVVLVTGDAYVDHPAFGAAVIGRILEQEGLRVAILAQPNWQDDLRDFRKFGAPRMFFAVTAGNMDSMVNHYTANKRLRSDDAYTPGGKAGFRPDYATSVYTRILKKIYPETPVIIGGVEASLRRLTHYDYWSDGLMPGILYDSGADLLLYGMAEQSVREVVRQMKDGAGLNALRAIPQTAYLLADNEEPGPYPEARTVSLPSHEECLLDIKAFAAMFKVVETESNRWSGSRLVQKTGTGRIVVNPACPPMKPGDLDASFDLPYTRLPHPKYLKRGPVPAYEMIRHSINLHRGCFGGCSFCTISMHQGKFVSGRSGDSILKEVGQVTEMPDFKGHITDLGGPSANMYGMHGKDLDQCRKCARYSCIYPGICPNLDTDHRPLTALYRQVSGMPGVRRVTIGSGVRYDLFVGRPPKEAGAKGYEEYLEQLVTRHVSGRLKVAPEHTSEKVLKTMRKPSFHLFVELKQKFDQLNRKHGLNQQLIPYFISGHPGCTAEDMAELAAGTKKLGYRLEQVQDLTPTPMTLSSVIYYTGLHPYTMKPLYTATSAAEKQAQQKFFFWYKKENQAFIRNFLINKGRKDLLRELF